MKTAIKVSLFLAILSPLANADSSQLWNMYHTGQRAAQRESSRQPTVAVSTQGRGVGERRVQTITTTKPDKFEITQDPHGNYRTMYRTSY